MSEQNGMEASDESVRRKRFVLVVDNNQRDANYLVFLLQNLGYNSTVVRSGEEALEFTVLAVPALVVAELVLPGINGLDLASRFGQDSLLSAVPMIIQTRFTSVEIEDRVRRAGVAGYVNKPVQPFELFRAVQQALEPTPRQNIRVPVLLNASVGEASMDRDLVTMLSDEGLFLRTADPHPVGSQHVLTFVLGSRVIRVDAVVLYAYRFSEQPQKEPGMGMKFLNLSPVDKDAIQSHIRAQVSPGIAPEQP